MKKILGRAWVLYEVIFVLGLMLILAISASAAGAVFHENWGWPEISGIGLMLLVIVWLTYYGRTWVEKSLTIWSVLVSLMLLVLGILTVSQNTETITLVFENDRTGAGWWRGGALFFMYNVMVVPTLMYTVRHINSRKQAWGAGLIGGFLTALPAFVYHLTFMSQYPAILDESLPTFQVVQHLGLPVMTFVYVVILFGAIANTGAGLLHGFNERLDGWWFELHGQAISKPLHASIAGIAVVASLLLANFGIIALVAKGYGSAAWLSLALLILPLLTVGTWKMFRSAGSSGISEPKTEGN